MKELFEYLVAEFKDGKSVKIEDAIAKMGLSGRIVDVRVIQPTPDISNDTKAAVFLRQAIPGAMICPICGGLLDPKKSSTFDHIVRRRQGGTGDVDNVQMAHPYCNDGYKN